MMIIDPRALKGFINFEEIGQKFIYMNELLMNAGGIPDCSFEIRGEKNGFTVSIYLGTEVYGTAWASSDLRSACHSALLEFYANAADIEWDRDEYEEGQGE